MAFSTTKGRTLLGKAAVIMPRGVPYGYGAMERGHTPSDAYPLFVRGGDGSRFTDLDGNIYVDLYGAHGTRILGYKHPAVLKAMREALDTGASTALAHPAMVEAAAALVAQVTIADWAALAPSGAYALRTAVSIARAATGKSTLIVVRDAQYGHPWFSQRPGLPGVIDDDFTHLVPARWGKIDDLDAALAAHSATVAAIIVPGAMGAPSRETHDTLKEYWAGLRAACDRTSIPLIVDEVGTGFRLHPGGSDQYYGVNADLICFDSVIAGGEPMGAVCGVDSLRWWAGAVPHGVTPPVSALSCVAAVATLKELAKRPSAEALSDIGRPLVAAISDAASTHGVDLAISGEPSLWAMRITTDDNTRVHQTWLAECSRRGVYFNPAGPQYPSLALSKTDISLVTKAVDDAFGATVAAHPEHFG